MATIKVSDLISKSKQNNPTHIYFYIQNCDKFRFDLTDPIFSGGHLSLSDYFSYFRTGSTTTGITYQYIEKMDMDLILETKNIFSIDVIGIGDHIVYDYEGSPLPRVLRLTSPSVFCYTDKEYHIFALYDYLKSHALIKSVKLCKYTEEELERIYPTYRGYQYYLDVYYLADSKILELALINSYSLSNKTIRNWILHPKNVLNKLNLDVQFLKSGSYLSTIDFN